MKGKKLILASLSLIAVFILAGGCSKDEAPAPLALDQIAGEMNKVFAGSPPKIKDLAAQAATAVQGKDLIKATMLLENLSAEQELSEPQRRVTAAALLTMNLELTAAAQRGDKTAAELNRVRERSR